jgi:hypothetical protein
MSRIILISILVMFSVFSCSDEKTFKIKDFDPIANFNDQHDTIKYKVDLSNALIDGIVIPAKGDDVQHLQTKFSIINKGSKPKSYYYKVYYQNESYKYEEMDGLFKNEKSSDNFYGSWNTDGMGFHKTPVIPNNGDAFEIIDSLVIMGNPRNEKRYFGANPQSPLISEISLTKMMEGIKSNEEWFNQIKEKAKKNNKSVEEQLESDAKWTIMRYREKGDLNNRWKRNPRVGVYSFLLVVVEENMIHRIPDYLKDVSVINPESKKFENPYYHFLNTNHYEFYTSIKKSERHLKVSAQVDLTKGIFSNISQTDTNDRILESSNYCSCNDTLFYDAHVEQFFHNVNKNFSFENTPKVYDVVGDNYTVEQFKTDTAQLVKEALITDHIRIADHACATVGYDEKENAVFLTNPGNEGKEKPVKENVGIKTRHGFTYGKFRAKIAFPEIISQSGVWNGLTCAFWLVYQEGKWNTRGICEKGYRPQPRSRKSDVKYDKYSEIDIEIVKTSKYWPKTSYSSSDYPVDDALNNNVMVTVTNWDLACHDPSDFVVGAKDFEYNGHTFTLHRWDDWYKAVTSKFEYPQEKTLGKPIYYEVEWKPNEIIWRMGEDENNMVVIGYMNEKSTKIPDNQMIMVVTQEFHDATWWPLAPFSQNHVPFPLKDITGYVYEMTIE